MSQEAGLCLRCRWGRRVESKRGSLFMLCGRAAEDERFPKYPKLPVTYCVGYEPGEHRRSGGPNIEPSF